MVFRCLYTQSMYPLIICLRWNLSIVFIHVISPLTLRTVCTSSERSTNHYWQLCIFLQVSLRQSIESYWTRCAQIHLLFDHNVSVLCFNCRQCRHNHVYQETILCLTNGYSSKNYFVAHLVLISFYLIGRYLLKNEISILKIGSLLAKKELRIIV